MATTIDKNIPGTNPAVGTDANLPLAPVAPGTVHVPGADTPVSGSSYRSGSVRAPDAGFKPRMGRGLFGVDPASREVSVPGLPRMTVGEALHRLEDEHPDFSGNAAKLADAFAARA